MKGVITWRHMHAIEITNTLGPPTVSSTLTFTWLQTSRTFLVVSYAFFVHSNIWGRTKTAHTNSLSRWAKIAYSISLKSRDRELRKELEWTQRLQYTITWLLLSHTFLEQNHIPSILLTRSLLNLQNNSYSVSLTPLDQAVQFLPIDLERIAIRF